MLYCSGGWQHPDVDVPNLPQESPLPFLAVELFYWHPFVPVECDDFRCPVPFPASGQPCFPGLPLFYCFSLSGITLSLPPSLKPFLPPLAVFAIHSFTPGCRVLLCNMLRMRISIKGKNRQR